MPGLTGPVTVSFSAQGLASISAGEHPRPVPRAGLRAREVPADGARRGAAPRRGPPRAAGRPERPGQRRVRAAPWPAAHRAERVGAHHRRRPRRAARLRPGRQRRHRRRSAPPATGRRSSPSPASTRPVDPGRQPGRPGGAHPGTRLHDGPAGLRSSWSTSLGAANTADWFPTLAKNTQTPYDPGPYVKAPLTPVAPDVASSAPRTGDHDAPPRERRSGAVSVAGATRRPVHARQRSDTSAVASVLDQLSQLLPNQIHHYPDSNAWAANGPAVAGASAGQPRRCSAVTRTCRRRCRPSGTRSRCPRPGTRWRG